MTLGRTGESNESHAPYLPCGDAGVELIDLRDPDARGRRLPSGEQWIEHIAFEIGSDLGELREQLEARGVEASWPPFRSDAGEMIWTTAETSGGVQYQFWRRLPGGEEQ